MANDVAECIDRLQRTQARLLLTHTRACCWACSAMVAAIGAGAGLHPDFGGHKVRAATLQWQLRPGHAHVHK